MTRTRLAYGIGAILLLATIGIPAWLLSRPVQQSTESAISVDSLDVVCTGRVDAVGLVRSLDPVRPGRIVKLHVTEGADVKAGEAIVSIDDRDYVEMVKEAGLACDVARIEVEAAQAKAKKAASDIEALQLNIEAAKVRVAAAAIKLDQMRQQVGASTSIPVTAADVDVQEAELRSFRLNIDAEQIRLSALKAIDQDLEVRAAQKRVEAANDALIKTKRYQQDCTITAPSDGTIVRMQCGVGAMLAPNPMDPGVVFAPAGPLIVRAEVEQADISRISMNMPATVRDDSRDATTWSGRVTAISRWVAPKRAILLDPGNFNDVRTTEVIITLDPSPKRLWIGQRMVVRFGK